MFVCRPMFCDLATDEMDSTVLKSSRAGQFLKLQKEFELVCILTRLRISRLEECVRRGRGAMRAARRVRRETELMEARGSCRRARTASRTAGGGQATRTRPRPNRRLCSGPRSARGQRCVRRRPRAEAQLWRRLGRGQRLLDQWSHAGIRGEAVWSLSTESGSNIAGSWGTDSNCSIDGQELVVELTHRGRVVGGGHDASEVWGTCSVICS